MRLSESIEFLREILLPSLAIWAGVLLSVLALAIVVSRVWMGASLAQTLRNFARRYRATPLLFEFVCLGMFLAVTELVARPKLQRRHDGVISKTVFATQWELNRLKRKIEHGEPQRVTWLERTDRFTRKPTRCVEKGRFLRLYSVGPDEEDQKCELAYDPTNGLYSAGDLYVELDREHLPRVRELGIASE